MKDMSNTTTRNRFFTKRWLFTVFLAIVALLLVACDDGGGGGTTTTDEKPSIAGTFSYSDIIALVGTEKISDPPTWEDPVPPGGVAYSLARVDGSLVASEISINESTGAITVADTATRSSLDQYRVSATATGEYKGTIETNVNILVQSFAYDPLNINSVTTFSHTKALPTILNIPTATFALKENPTDGLEVEATTGEVTVNSLRLRTGTYIIAITEGAENYDAAIEVNVHIQPTTNAQLKTVINAAISDVGNNVDLNFIDISSVTDISGLFWLSEFNGDVSRWDVSHVTSMEELFTGAGAFDGDISGWDVSHVTNMKELFTGAGAFDGDISGWDVSNVTNMGYMFAHTGAFNQDISGWDVSNVTNMQFMFYRTGAFNQDISGWNVSGVTNMKDMFSEASAFNQDISGWTVSSVTTMENMFNEASVFNGDISGWNVSNVTNMSSMFNSASAFNQNISGWTVSSATTMANMFNGASAFNQDITAWAVVGAGTTVTVTDMFVGSGLAGSEPNWYTNPTTP